MIFTNDNYRMVLELEKVEAEGNRLPLATLPVDPDLRPALEWARFMSKRKDDNGPMVLESQDGEVEPIWDTHRGQPFLKGLSVKVARSSGEVDAFEIGKEYFKDQAKEASTKLVEQGQLEAGEVFEYRVCAYPRDAEPQAPTGGSELGLSVEAIAAPLPLAKHSLDDFVARSIPSGEIAEGSYPAFIPQKVLDEAIAQTLGAGAAETGGILMGHLHRDPSLPEVFAEVTAMIPAHQAKQELTRLTFDDRCWEDVDRAIRLRNRGEIQLGWFHSHPARQWCKDCPVENQRKCKLSGEFFSDHDVILHRTVFPRAYSLALVISDSLSTGVTWPLFGWSQGMVKQRGFYILDSKAVVPVGSGAGAEVMEDAR